MEEFHLYKDIKARTGGEIFLGVVGPVRTGKSTFVRHFMELLVLPNLKDQEKKIATDELPTSGKGKTITTVEPKFVPKEAALLRLPDQTELKVRLVDCVGFPVKGADGMTEEEQPRMVKTPWSLEEMPFEKAAVLGTEGDPGSCHCGNPDHLGWKLWRSEKREFPGGRETGGRGTEENRKTLYCTGEQCRSLWKSGHR